MNMIDTLNKFRTFKHSTMKEARLDDIKDLIVLFNNEKSVCLAVQGKKELYLHWAAESLEDLFSEMSKIPNALYAEFVPEEEVALFEEAGFYVSSEWVEFFNYDIKNTDIHGQKYENIEFLSHDEIGEAVKMSLECEYQSRGFEAETAEWFTEWMDGQDKNNIIKVSENKIVTGIVCVSIYGSHPTVWIRRIQVKPSFQNKGYGKKLMEAALCYGIHHGAVRSFLHADFLNKNAIGLYEKYGFETKGRGGCINMKRKPLR